MTERPDDPALPGMPHRTVRLAQSTPRWAALFAEEATRLRAALGSLGRDVQHYGSTSVPGLSAKPILDILVGTSEPLMAPPFIAALAPLGYDYAPHAGVPEHLVFGKGAARTHLVHVVVYEGPAWHHALRFRDRLRADPVLAAEYDLLKQRLAAAYPIDRARYTAEKSAFIHRVLDLP